MEREVRVFREQWNALQTELQDMPVEPQHPQLPPPFAGMSLEAARETVKRDSAQFAAASGNKAPWVLIAVGILGLISAVALAFLRVYAFAAISGIAGLGALLWGFWEKWSMKKHAGQLLEK